MDRSFTVPSLPKSLKRASSLTELEIYAQDYPRLGVNRKSTSKQKAVTKAYKGRYSLKTGGAAATKIQRRKSGNNNKADKVHYANDEEDDYLSDELVMTPSPSMSKLRCLPVIDRESSSSSSSDERKSSDSHPVAALMLTVERLEDTRLNLFSEINSFVANPSNKTNNASKLVVNQKPGFTSEGEYFLKTIVIERNSKKKSDYLAADVLWLMLKAFFSGKNVCAGQDGTFDEDSFICKKREHKWHIIEDLYNYEALQFPTKYCLDTGYITHITSTKNNIHALLNGVDEYMSLFPKRKLFFNYIEERVNKRYAAVISERIDVLTAWLNTVEDLCKKIQVLGEIFEIERLPDVEKVWPRWIGQNVCTHVLQARPVFSAYVSRSLHLKGMKKVLSRVTDVTENSLAKAALLLYQPASYAQAASGNRSQLPLTEEMRRRYDSETDQTSSVKFGAANEQYKKMHLPSLIPYFAFILGVRMELVLEWLKIRSETSVPDDEEVDALSLSVLIEDSHDCIEEAVSVKRNYLSYLQVLCPRKKHVPDEFDVTLNNVFMKYLDYVERWCRKTAEKDYVHELFTRMECEWRSASFSARSIHDGLHDLSSTYSTIIPYLVEKLILEYWEYNAESIQEEHTMPYIMSNELEDEASNGRAEDMYASSSTQPSTPSLASPSSELASPGLHSQHSSIFVTCRKHQKMLREVKDRTMKVYALLRTTVFADLHDVSGYKMTDYAKSLSEAELCRRLSDDHCLVDFAEDSEEIGFSLLADVHSLEASSINKLLLALSEERRPSKELNGHLIVIPNMTLRSAWKGKVFVTSLDEEMRSSFRFIRKNLIMVCGNYDLSSSPKYRDLFNLIANFTSSNDIVNDHSEGLIGSLVDCSGQVWSFLEDMWNVYKRDLQVLEESLDEEKKKRKRNIYSSNMEQGTPNLKDDAALTKLEQAFLLKKDNIHSTMKLAFTLIFYIYKELVKLSVDSFQGRFVQELMEKVVDILEMWKELVKDKHPEPTRHIPRWATDAFNFMLVLADPKYTAHLSDDLVDRFSDCFAECKQMIVSYEATSTPAVIQRRTSRTASFGSWEKSPGNGLSRRKLLQERAEEVDKIRDIKIRKHYPLGKVCVRKPLKFDFDDDSSSSKVPFKWELMEFIGSGTFAKVYKGFNVDKKCVIAVKKMPLDKQMRPTIEREIDIFRGLSHPNLVTYYGFQWLQGSIHILMEYCAEGTLERICRDGGLDMYVVRECTNSLLQAIDYLHKHHVVHRDIKPENVFLDTRCRLKLGDFGCSVRLRDNATVVGEIKEHVGTVAYMAPEVHTWGETLPDGTQRGYGRAVDIWSLGCVVLQMVTGNRPWEGNQSYHIILRVSSGEKPAYPANPPQILRNFLDSCFVFDPKKRKSAEALLQDIFANVHRDIDTVYSVTNDFATISL